jgi:hypothetical protein
MTIKQVAVSRNCILWDANRWAAVGNQTTLYVYPECPHAFVGFPTQMAKLANLRVNDWINGLLK